MQVEGTATSIKTTPCADALITHGARAYVSTTVLLSLHAENAVDAADLNTPCASTRLAATPAASWNVPLDLKMKVKIYILCSLISTMLKQNAKTGGNIFM